MNRPATGAAEGAVIESASRVPGTVRVHARVIDKVIRESSAAAIGVSRSDLEVDVGQWDGGLAVRIATLLPIPNLADTESIRMGPPVVERIRLIQATLAPELARLTGRRVRQLSVTVTGAVVPERKRVR